MQNNSHNLEEKYLLFNNKDPDLAQKIGNDNIKIPTGPGSNKIQPL